MLVSLASFNSSTALIFRAVVSAREKASRAILTYEAELEFNLLRLCQKINNREYVHGTYDLKIVNEKNAHLMENE